MKKHIFKTIGIILGVSSIIGAGVLVSAANFAISPNVLIVNKSTALYNGNYTNVSFKDAVVGTKRINNGNYVLYFGSQSIESNLKFLYNVPKDSSWSEFLNILASNQITELSGEYWKAINYIRNTSEKPWINSKTKPEFVSYVHKVNEQSLLRKERFAKSLESYLKEVARIAPNFSNLSKKDQDKYEKMLKFVNDNTGGKSGQRKIPNSIYEFNAETNQNVTWTIAPSNLTTWTYSPFAQYTDLSGKQQYFNDDKDSADFRNLWTFIKSRFSTAKDISTSEGFILGFEKGVLVKKYSLSFDNETPPPENDPNKPSNPSTPTKQIKNNSLIIKENSTNEGGGVSKPNSSFYTWLDEVYGNKQ